MTTNSLRLCVASALVCLLAGSSAALGQTTVNGSIRGVIRDEQGAVLPGVSLAARSPTVAGTFEAVSDTAGTYRLIDLPPGEYVVRAELQGFSGLERSGIVVRAGLNLALDMVLRVGGARGDGPGEGRHADARGVEPDPGGEHRGRAATVATDQFSTRRHRLPRDDARHEQLRQSLAGRRALPHAGQPDREPRGAD